MDFEVERLEGDPGSTGELMRLNRRDGPILARTEPDGARTVLLDDGEVLGRIAYGPRRPADRTLVPRSVDPGASVSMELRSRPGVVWQERGAIIGARRRALTIELEGRRFEAWQAWGTLHVADASGSATAEVDVRRGQGSARGDDAVLAADLLFLLLASTVTRHLSSLTT